MYPKGALVLWMLQKELGREPFWAAMNRYLTSHAYGNATSDDLRQAVVGATGRSLPWFWSQWIYQAGHPEFSVASRYDSAASALVLTVRQTQQDTATADSSGVRFSVPQAFRAPIAVSVRSSNRRHRGRPCVRYFAAAASVAAVASTVLMPRPPSSWRGASG